jgi:mono/diheme cytochrome c family protein
MRRIAFTVAFLASSTLLADDSVTYTKHVAPILWKNCATCHRPGEVGPFSLLTYQDAAKRAEFLAEITANRRMPPWKAEPHYGEFHDARTLSDDEIATIGKWAAAGAPEGNPRDLPPAPTFPDGWQLGKPDLVIKMSQAYQVPADGKDIYRCFVLPIPTDEDKTVAAWEFRPGNRRVVHHAILYLDHRGAARKRDGEDGSPGYMSFGGPGVMPTGSLGGWAPGSMPRRLPEGAGKFLRHGSDLVLQIHYHPNGKAETDESTVGIYFTEKPAQKLVTGVALRSRKLNIKAGERNYQASAESSPLPCDVHAVCIFPHMHMLGKEMKVWAETPDGKTVPLIWIKDWDFNWQGAYFYQQPILLAKGTVLKLTAAYDNSADNPANPNNPPKDVHWGEQTADEMCLCGVSVMTDSRLDLLRIARMPGNGLGTILDGGIAPDELDAEHEQKFSKIMPARGLPIPARYKAALSFFDKDSDGHLTAEEVRNMPAPIRNRVRDAVLERLGE